MPKKMVAKTKKAASKIVKKAPPAKNKSAAKKTAAPKKTTNAKKAPLAKKAIAAKKPAVAKAKAKPAKSAAKPKKVSYIAKGHNNVTACLIVSNAVKAIEFYKNVFNAKEVFRMDHASGKVTHAALKIGDTKIMLADEMAERNTRSPQAIGGSPVIIHLYTKNTDDTMKRAQAAGAKMMKAAEDTFYGDRVGSIEDPFGHHWLIATHIEDVSNATVKKRAAELSAKK